MKTILVTGAAGNLGKSVVEQLHQSGYRIIATTNSEKDAAAFSGFPNITAQTVNVLDDASIALLLEKNRDIQAAVLLVGGFAGGNIHQTDGALFEKMFQLNFMSAFNIVKPLLARFEAQGGGQFVFVGARSSLNAHEGKDLFAYTMSKTLVFKMAELINAHGKEHQITATVIVPSIIDTPPNRTAMPEAVFSKWITPQSIGKTIAFLLSDEGKMWHEPIIKIYNQA